MTNPYRSVLRTPGALRFAVAGFVGRMPMAMMTIAVLLVVRHSTGSYGIAGAASAAHTLAGAAATPFIGRLADRRGQSAVVPKLLVIYLGGVAILELAALTHASVWLLFVGAVVAGAGQLPYPSLVRSRWTYLLGQSSQLSTALALESAADEVVYMIGPVLVTGLAAINALLAPIAAAALALAGTLPFIGARLTEPPPAAHGSRAAAWRVRAMWVLIASSVMIGVVFGNVEVAMVAFAQRHGASGLAGVLLALIALGSMVVGLWYGARRWVTDLAVRYRISLATLALGSLPAVAADSVWEMAPCALLIGVSIAPTLIASSGLVARVVHSDALTEGFTWQSTGILVGVAGGAALAGLLIDAVSVRAAFAAGPVAAGLAALIALRWGRLLLPQPAPAPTRNPAQGSRLDRLAQGALRGD